MENPYESPKTVSRYEPSYEIWHVLFIPIIIIGAIYVSLCTFLIYILPFELLWFFFLSERGLSELYFTLGLMTCVVAIEFGGGKKLRKEILQILFRGNDYEKFSDENSPLA